MTRFLRGLYLITALPLTVSAQDAAKPAAAPPEAQQPAKPEEAKPDASAPAAAAATPSPVANEESWLTGSIDLGYRWLTNVGGNFDAYRSLVNLGSGPQLIGADFTIADPKQRLFDHIHVRAQNWGDDPYEAVHVNATKRGIYDFNGDYRDFAYFNFLPSVADPLLSRGLVLAEQSFDNRRRIGAFTLDLMPGHRIQPYLAYETDSSSGSGVMTFVDGATNSFPVPDRLRDLTNQYRGGVHLEFNRWHATLEQGGTTFKNDQNVYQNAGSVLNYGNQYAPVFGQTLDLASLAAAYGIRGTSVYSKGLFSANPYSWLDLYGQFLYSQPDSNVSYQQAPAGNLYLQQQLLFYNSEQFLLTAASKLPHTSGNVGLEVRPFRHVRIMETWLTDRLHNASSASSTDLLTALGSSQALAALLGSTLATNYNQQEINVFVEAPWHVTLRGGYRYVWGDAQEITLPSAGLASSDHDQLHRNVGIGAVTFRPNQKLSATGEIEAGSSSGVYFRTSLYDYQKLRMQARYQLTGSLSASADYTLLKNQNPIVGINYDSLSSQESISLFWSPAGGKRFDVEGSYSRSDLRADFNYIEPEFLQPTKYRYREDDHVASGLVSVNLPHGASKLIPKFTAGGSFFISSGSRPTNYYQPLMKLWVPLHPKVAWFAEWRYYGYGESFYAYEGFRTNLVTTGFRISR